MKDLILMPATQTADVNIYVINIKSLRLKTSNSSHTTF